MDTETKLGLDDLVEAILKPKYDTFASDQYWSEFARLLRDELGTVPESWRKLVDGNIRSLSARVLPIEGYLEAPKFIVDTWQAMDQEALYDVKKRMRAVQADYLRSMFVALDPAFATRTTTFGVLVERGFDPEAESVLDDPW